MSVARLVMMIFFLLHLEVVSRVSAEECLAVQSHLLSHPLHRTLHPTGTSTASMLQRGRTWIRTRRSWHLRPSAEWSSTGNPPSTEPPSGPRCASPATPSGVLRPMWCTLAPNRVACTHSTQQPVSGYGKGQSASSPPHATTSLEGSGA